MRLMTWRALSISPYRRGLGVRDLLRLHDSNAVLRADAAPPRRRPLVHVGLDHRLQRGVVAPR